jgi:hypothetical protein
MTTHNRLYGTRIGRVIFGGGGGGDNPPGELPTWRTSGSQVKDSWYQLANTLRMNGATITGFTSGNPIDLWCTFAVAPTKLFSVWSSGHAQWPNGAHVFDLSLNTPMWSTLHPGSHPGPGVGEGWTKSTDPVPPSGTPITRDKPYNRDGIGVSSHTYEMLYWVAPSQSRDGKERVMRLGIAAAGPLDTGPDFFQEGSYCHGYNVTDNTYDPVNTWADQPDFYRYYTRCQDPRSGDVYYMGPSSGNLTQRVLRWTASTGVWWSIYPVQQYGDGSGIKMNAWTLGAGYPVPRCFDITRNRIVGLVGGGDDQPGTATMQCMNISGSSGVPVINISNITVTGAITGAVGAWGMVHDRDNDRYIVGMPTASMTAFYSINPTTGAATYLNTIAQGINQGGLFDRLSFNETYHCLVYVPDYGANVYYMPTVTL